MAREDKQNWISNKIKILVGEGYPQKQAVAIAYSMWNDKHKQAGGYAINNTTTPVVIPTEHEDEVKPRYIFRDLIAPKGERAASDSTQYETGFNATMHQGVEALNSRMKDLLLRFRDLAKADPKYINSNYDMYRMGSDYYSGYLDAAEQLKQQNPDTPQPVYGSEGAPDLDYLNRNAKRRFQTGGINYFLPQPTVNYSNQNFPYLPEAPAEPQSDLKQSNETDLTSQETQDTFTLNPVNVPQINPNSYQPILSQDFVAPLSGGENYAQEQVDRGLYTPDEKKQKEPKKITINPYAGVDIPTAATVLGESIKDGNTLLGIASGLKVGAGLARNIFSGMGWANRAQQVAESQREKNRGYITQANSPVFARKGGTIPSLPDAPSTTISEDLDQDTKNKILTGEYITGVSGKNKSVTPGIEVEKGEHIFNNQGDSMEVVGDTHEQGGEDVQLQEGDMVISDDLKVGGKNAKAIRDKYDIKVKAKDTYANVIDKIYKKIGVSKLTKQEEDVISRIEKQEKNTEDQSTRELNLQHLRKVKQKIQEEKSDLEPERMKALHDIFNMQENSKTKKEGATKKAQKGGEVKPSFEEYYKTIPQSKNDTSNYDLRAAYENLPYEQMVKFATSDAHLPDTYKLPNHPTFSNESVYFDPKTNLDSAGHWVETDSSWKYIPYNPKYRDTVVENKMAEGGTIGELAKQYGLTEDEVVQVLQQLPKLQTGGQYITSDILSNLKPTDIFGTASGLVHQPENNGYFGSTNADTFAQAVQANPWYFAAHPDFDPTDKEEVKDYQSTINKYLPKDKQIAVDGKWGEQTNSAKIYYIPKNVLPTFTVTADKPENSGGNPQNKKTKDKDEKEKVKLDIPLLPEQYALPPTAVQPALKTNRRYDTVEPSLISPEQIIEENNRQAQAAIGNLSGLPDSMRAAAVAQISANTQSANERAVQQAEQYNAQIKNRAGFFNARVQEQQENANAQDALSFEQRQQTAQAKTDENIRRYLDFMNKVNTQKFNDIRRMNTVNQLFENYDIDSLGNISTENGLDSDQLMQMYRANPQLFARVVEQYNKDKQTKKKS